MYGAELEGERPYLVVELLGRGTLAERLDERGSLSLEETLAIGLALTRALRHAHGIPPLKAHELTELCELRLVR